MMAQETQDAQAPAAAAPKKKAPKIKKKSRAKKSKKKAAFIESKYKSRALVENTERTYRFDAKGNPIVRGEKKKSTEHPARKDACSTEEPCADKNPDADAL